MVGFICIVGGACLGALAFNLVLHGILRTPRYIRRTIVWLRECVARLRSQWTITPWRLGWWSYKGFADSRTPLLLESAHSSSDDSIYTSKLCQECFRIVSQSGLLSGSILPLTRRREWHDWVIPIHSSGLRKDACHLCRMVWFSIGHDTRNRAISENRQTLEKNIGLQARILIWKDASAGSNGSDRLFLQPFYYDYERSGSLCGPISIVEG
jgi:hypothetical protein